MQTYMKPYILRAGAIAGVAGAIVLLLSLIPIVGLCFLLLAWIVYAGAGVFAAMWGRTAGALTTLSQGAIDGAVAGAMAGVIAHVVKLIADIIVGLVFNAAVSSDAGPMVGGLISLVVGALISLIVGIIAAAILGAIGGLVYNAVKQQPKPTVS